VAWFVEPSSTPDGPGLKPGTALDAITDPETLCKSDPRFIQRFEDMAELRRQHDELATYTNHGRVAMGARGDGFMRVASIPHTVLQAALVLEPDLLISKKKFYAWLDRHPEYQAYTRKRGQ